MNLPTLRAGTAKITITPTPAEGVYLSGFIYREKPCQGVHDDLYARVLLLKTDEQTVGIVTLDLIATTAELVRDVRQRAQEITGINGDDIMVTASHTHSGPTIGALRGCGAVDADRLELLKKKIVQGIEQASRNMVEARVGVGTGQLPNMTYNRHQVLKDGTVAMPLQPEEEVVKQGPVDHTVRVLRVDNTAGSPLAVLVNFACHPALLDHGNLLISADYVGYMTQAVEKHLGGGVAIFANGACGNINPLNFNVTNDVSKQYEYAQTLGEALGAEAVEIAEQIKTAPGANIRMASAIINAPLCLLPTKQELERLLDEKLDILQQIKRGEIEIHPSNLNFSRNGQINYMSTWIDYLRESLAKVSSSNVDEYKSVPMEIQAIALNDIVLVGIPGEPYTEIASTIQKKVRPKRCLILGYTNGTVGYIPNRDAHQDGGYTVERAHRFFGQLAALAPDAEDIIIDAAVNLVEKCRPQTREYSYGK